MGNQNITAELLEKYHSGLCNAQETSAVEAWLESDQEDIIEHHSVDQEQIIETAIWHSIQESMVPTKKSGWFLRKPAFYWGGIAASAVICLFSLLYFLRTDQTNNNSLVTINNVAGTFAVEKHIKGLTLTAMPRSNFQAVVNHEKYTGDVKFCNMMLIRNDSDDDIQLNFRNDCGQNLTKSKTYKCQKGITYVAVKIDWKSPEIVVVDQRYLEDLLPLNIAMKINKDLQSI